MKAVLFDLDGTLLDLDLSSFIRRYFSALEEATLSVSDAMTEPMPFIAALDAATRRMMDEHAGATNRDVFFEAFRTQTGVDLDAYAGVFDDFYAHTFPELRGDAVPMAGATEAVAVARALGLRTAIATNPIFPRAAVEHRLAWAGFRADEFDLITTYETMQACKPRPAYYRQVAALLGVSPSDCVMVGDDPVLDMSAADVGMRTYYVGADSGVVATYEGDLHELAALLPRLV